MVAFGPLLPWLPFLLVSSRPSSTSTSALIDQAHVLLQHNDTDTAFSLLAQAHAQNDQAPGLLAGFEAVFRQRIACNKVENVGNDRLGLGSLLLERGKYGDAAQQFELALQDSSLTSTQQDRVASSLYKARAATCDWNSRQDDNHALQSAVQRALHDHRVPSVHPYEALMWPCLSLEDCTQIAHQFGQRALATVDSDATRSTVNELSSRTSNEQYPTIYIDKSNATQSRRRIRVGYISADFVGTHPMAFLMQDVFRFHSNRVELYLYSLMKQDDSKEVQKLHAAATKWTELVGVSSHDAVSILKQDHLDLLVDLTGYTGTSQVAEILAQQVAPIQLGYMGFPASTHAQFIDYIGVDATVVPSFLRQYYSERLLVLPHCYYANSHRHLNVYNQMNIEDKTSNSMGRSKYYLPPDAFVYCCHNRAEKLDPSTFRSWLRVLQQVPNSVLWLLREGDEMETNLRRIAEHEFDLPNHRLIFSEKVPRHEHLQRLHYADLFLDPPAYNSHTTGIDGLMAGVPMVSLLRPAAATVSDGEVATEKLASRVGASFLKTLHLSELVVSTMADYERLMVKCATDDAWFSEIQERLKNSRFTSPLFDTQRWVQNWEMGLVELVNNPEARKCDVYIVDQEP